MVRCYESNVRFSPSAQILQFYILCKNPGWSTELKSWTNLGNRNPLKIKVKSFGSDIKFNHLTLWCPETVQSKFRNFRILESMGRRPNDSSVYRSVKAGSTHQLNRFFFFYNIFIVLFCQIALIVIFAHIQIFNLLSNCFQVSVVNVRSRQLLINS